MPESPVDRDQTDPIRPAAPRRDVPDWEYRTAYINYFQVRLPVELYGRLRGWAERDRKPAADLLIDILEEAVRGPSSIGTETCHKPSSFLDSHRVDG